MSNKSKASSSSGGKSSSASSSQRKSTFFINGEGIDREVITTDICRYLGNDALVKPATHTDPSTRLTQEGYLITAYRPPTSEQLRDLRNDSAKWREERLRNSARSQGGYDQSDTQQEVRMRGNPDDSRPPGFQQTTYGGTTMSTNQNMGPPSQTYTNPLAYTVENSGMPPPSVQPNRYPGYQPSESNYTYAPSQAQPSNYSVPGNSRERMEMPQGPSWNMQPSSGYQPPGAQPPTSNYGQTRPQYNYSPVGGHPSVPAGYGRGNPPENYNPYGPRESGVQPPDTQDFSYGANDDDMMDSEESFQQPQPPTQVQPRRDRERDSRERTHEEPTKRRHHRS